MLIVTIVTWHTLAAIFFFLIYLPTCSCERFPFLVCQILEEITEERQQVRSEMGGKGCVPCCGCVTGEDAPSTLHVPVLHGFFDASCLRATSSILINLGCNDRYHFASWSSQSDSGQQKPNRLLTGLVPQYSHKESWPAIWLSRIAQHHLGRSLPSLPNVPASQ